MMKSYNILNRITLIVIFCGLIFQNQVNAAGEFKLISTIHNIKMIQRFIKKKLKIKDPPIDWIDRLIKIAKKPAMATV